MGLHRKCTNTLTRAASASSGDETVECGGAPALLIFSSVDDANPNVNSDGWDSFDMCTCNYTVEVNFLTTLLGALGIGSLSRKMNTVSINILNGGNGWTAKITAITTSGFTLTWTKVGSGRNVTIKTIALL